eukprot:CAMPEP_0118892414 /NCGR_PEP_ID=MMETSP1166-20130328/2021_1 /TAXON_ID=1104430 /ORGANISM="Chrysoreinhardia sp, Strain CCMP3193" /LENGTH=467 /DNA_ID=CAMNT_0006831135 /DNA_START=11 /DNA_END=1411 /DNA_ORIENTATION=-
MACEEEGPLKRKVGGNRITRALIRKRAEHNEGVISTLEEIALHQEELSRIDEVLGQSCRKLKILLLQNNIISKIENLHHLKDLEYLNLALNNIERIEGLASCEFLKKLDLTVNFVDVDTLEDSIAHLKPLPLKEIFLMGNPAAEWEGCKNYVIHSLPQLERYDGTEITRSERLVARRQYPTLCLELRQRKPREKPEVDLSKDESTPYVPEVRTAMYEEMAEQKDDAERRKKSLGPKERDYDQEQRDAVKAVRQQEGGGLHGDDAKDADAKVMQCNQGKWDFFFDEDLKEKHLALTVKTPRHLDSSLIDLDVHPSYISVVIKSKILRLTLPCEVLASKSFAQRSAANGHLVIFMPKVDDTKDRVPLFSKKYYAVNVEGKEKAGHSARTTGAASSKSSKDLVTVDGQLRPRVTRKKKPPSVATMMLSDGLDDENDDENADDDDDVEEQAATEEYYQQPPLLPQGSSNSS